MYNIQGDCMKNLTALFLILTLLMSIAGCSSEDRDPEFRVRNERSTKVSAQVKTSNGNTININNVEPGQTTGYQSVVEGLIEITVSIQGDTAKPTHSFRATKNNRYTIVAAAGDPPSIRVDQ